MIKITGIYNFVMPVWTICPLLYDEKSGLQNAEIKALDKFLEQIPKNGVWEFNDDEYFQYYNSVDNLGSTVMDVIYTVFE